MTQEWSYHELACSSFAGSVHTCDCAGKQVQGQDIAALLKQFHVNS